MSSHRPHLGSVQGKPAVISEAWFKVVDVNIGVRPLNAYIGFEGITGGFQKCRYKGCGTKDQPTVTIYPILTILNQASAI